MSTGLKLYEIAEELQNALTHLYDEDGVVDETALARFESADIAMKEKAVAISSFIKNLEAEADMVDQAKRAMDLREKRLAKQVANMKSYLQQNMEKSGITEISSSPYFVIKLKKCPPSVDDYASNLIPQSYWKEKVTHSLDKAKLLADLKAGAEINGARLKQSNRLEIK